MEYPKNFKRVEFLRSSMAKKKNIDNEPACECQERNLIKLANWLQKLRDALCAHYDRKMIVLIRSGYRSRQLNREVKGSKTSAHLKGLAADIVCPQLTSDELVHFIVSFMEDYDQVIEEFGIWVHVGLSDDEPREEALKARKVNGRTMYSQY